MRLVADEIKKFAKKIFLNLCLGGNRNSSWSNFITWTTRLVLCGARHGTKFTICKIYYFLNCLLFVIQIEAFTYLYIKYYWNNSKVNTLYKNIYVLQRKYNTIQDCFIVLFKHTWIIFYFKFDRIDSMLYVLEHSNITFTYCSYDFQIESVLQFLFSKWKKSDVENRLYKKLLKNASEKINCLIWIYMKTIKKICEGKWVHRRKWLWSATSSHNGYDFPYILI